MITTHHTVLSETLGDLTDLDVLDVGCGAGGLVRWFRAQGADVTGAECGVEMRRRALEADPEHAEAYVDAVGQDLPFGDHSLDIVVYSYSLHHVPVDAMADALLEARRVLRPNGTLVVIEPAIDPADRAIAAEVVDEAVERTAAQQLLDDATERGFDVRERSEYLTESTYPDFETWERDIVGIDPDRAAAMERHREHAREQFHRIAERRDTGWVIGRRNLLAVLTPRP